MSRATPLPTAAYAEEMLGEVRALAGTIGRPSGANLTETSAVLRLPAISSGAAWHRFLGAEFVTIIVTHEAPLILQAHEFARLGHARELVALDQTWGRIRTTLPAYLPSLSAASARVGQAQLTRLLALRDQRIVPRYLAAIAAGEAHGWHPLVYGLVLGIFALPLRQGLLHYGRQTAAGFLASTALATSLKEPAWNELIDDAEQALLVALPQLLPAKPLGVL